MAAFEAAILLPHNPAPIRVVDLYAQGVIMYVPGEPMIHRWMWGNRPFGGYRAPKAYISMAPPHLRDSLGSMTAPSEAPPDGHPPYSGIAYLAAWALQKHLPDRRYWLQYTEWELLPGLQRFSGIADLLQKLRYRDHVQDDLARDTMHLHLQGRRAEGLAWWRMAIAGAVYDHEV